MSDHVRKMNWQFDIPKTGKVVGSEHDVRDQGDEVDMENPLNLPVGTELQSNPDPSPEPVVPVDLPKMEKTTTAPVDFDTVSPVEPDQEEYQPVNPFLESAEQTTHVKNTDLITPLSAGTDQSMIDPDTGLEIPDYMKPFISN